MIVDPIPALLPVIRAGWRVFPVAGGAKQPPLILDFPANASAEEPTIRAWAIQFANCNWGVALDASGVFSLDLDGESGVHWCNERTKMHGGKWTDTKRAKTPNGTHYYYRLPAGTTIHSSTSAIAQGVDIKCWHSYCLVPPSQVGGHGYAWSCPPTLAPTAAPAWLIELVKAAAEKKNQPESSSTPAIIPAGERNSRLASIAGTLRRRGLGETAIGAALAAHNAEACVPPLDPVEVQEIANSIACYKPEPVLRVRPVRPVATVEENDKRITTLTQIPDPRTLRADALRFLIDDLIPANQITIVAGEYGCGKTFLAMMLARAILRGTAFLGRDVMRRETVIFLDRENPLSVIRERLSILFNEGETAHTHWGLWNDDEPPTLADSRLLEFAEQGAVIFFDSFVRFHDCDENSPTEMARVMGHLRKLQSAGATVILLHHRTKALDSGFRGTGEIAAGCDVLYSLGRAKDSGLLELVSVKDRLGVSARVTFRADWGEGVISTAEPAETMTKRALIAKIREVIERSPGTRQSEIVAEMKGTASRSEIQRALAQREGDLWRVEGGGKGAAKVYFPKLRIKK
jgi:archaellum biogenesis ATPase FlaH